MCYHIDKLDSLKKKKKEKIKVLQTKTCHIQRHLACLDGISVFFMSYIANIPSINGYMENVITKLADQMPMAHVSSKAKGPIPQNSVHII